MGCLRFLCKIIAFLLLVLFLAVLPLTVWSFNIQRALFDYGTHQRLLETRSLYTRVLPGFLPELVQGVEKRPGTPSEVQHASQLFAHLAEDDWEQVTKLLMPGFWVQSQLMYNVDAFFKWVDGTHVRPEFSVDLNEFKGRLGGEQGKEVIQLVIGSWPLCSEKEVEEMRSAFDTGVGEGDQVPFCHPEDQELRDLLTEQLETSIASVADELPDTLPTEEERSQLLTSQERDQLLAIKFTIRVVRRVSYLIFVFPVAFLLLIEILAVRSFKGLFRWYGWALFLGGLICLTLPLDVFFLTAWQTLSNASRTEVLLASAVALNQVIGQSILIQTGGITVAGLIFLALASILNEPRQDPVVEGRGKRGKENP